MVRISPEQEAEMAAYNKAMAAIEAADFVQLENYANADPAFPDSPMPYMETFWFHEAIVYAPPAVISWMISKGAALHFENDEGNSAISLACFRETDDMEEVVDLLIAFGADVNQPDCLGYTPLHDAAAARNLRVVRKLISVGADIAAVCRDGLNMTPLQFAKRFRRNREVIAAIEAASQS